MDEEGGDSVEPGSIFKIALQSKGDAKLHFLVYLSSLEDCGL